jgi:hypothetical protein
MRYTVRYERANNIYLPCVVSVLLILVVFIFRYVKCHNGDYLRLSIFSCYSWEMEVNFGFDVSFDNAKDWRGIRQKSGELI